MANLGTLWFDVDLNLQKLQQSIQNGNAQVLKDLKVSLAPNATELKEAIDSILKSQSFKVNLEASQEGLNKIKEQLGNLSGEVKLTSSGTTLSQESIKSIVELLSQQAQKTQEVTTATQSASEASKSAAKAANEEAESSKKANVERERQMKLLYEVQSMYSKIANLSPENSGMSPLKIKAVADSFKDLAKKLKDVPPKTSLQELAAEFSTLKTLTKGFFQEVGQSSKAVESIRLVRYALKEVNDQIASGITSSKLEGFREQLKTINREMHNLMKSGDFSGIQNLFAGHKGFSDGVVNIIRQMVTEMKNLGVVTSHLTTEEQRLAASIRHSTDSMRGQSQVLSDLKSMAMQYLSVWGAQSFIHSIIQTGGLLEQQRMSIGAILGDLSQANHLFGQITQLALKSPFGVVQLDTMSKQLTAYNFKYSELYDWTKRLADISAATGTEVSRLALALGHVRSEGALSGYTLRQFAMGNVPLLQTLSQQLGKTTSEIRKMTREKAITYDDVEKALKTLTDDGGIFANAQEVMSGALNAKFKNLHDAFDIMFGNMAESKVGDALKGVAETLTVLAKHWQETGAVILAVAGYMGLHKAATLTMNKAVIQSNLTTGQFTAKQLEAQAATGNLTKQVLLQAVATGKLAVADAEAAGATLGLSRAQLQQVATTGRVSAAYNLGTIATSKFTVAQLRMMATIRSASWASWTKYLTSFQLALSGIASGAKLTGVALKGMFLAAWPLLAISAITEVFMHFKQKADEADERVKDLMQTANEGFKALEKQAQNFKIGASLGMDKKQLQESISQMEELLKSYSPQSGNILSEAFKIDEATGKSVHSLQERYEMLAKAVEETKDSYFELGKVKDILEESNDDTDGWLDESFRENTEDYIDALKDRNKAENDFVAFHRTEIIQALNNTRGAFAELDKEISKNIHLFNTTDGNEGFAEGDLKAQLDLVRDNYEYFVRFDGEIRRAGDNAFYAWANFNTEARKTKEALGEVDKDMKVFTTKTKERLEAAFGASVENWTNSQKLAVQKSIEIFMTGINGYSDMAEKERMEMEEKLLAPFGIKIDIDARDANKQLTDMQLYLNNLVGKDWVVKLKLETVGSFEDLYDQLDKTVKKSGETIKKLGDGISEERKRLASTPMLSPEVLDTLTDKEKEYREAVLNRSKAIETANKEGFRLSSLDKENKKNQSAANKAETAAEKAAKARTKQAEAQMKIDEELAKQRLELEDAIADARVASIENNAERERVQREEEFKKQERQLDRQVEEWKRKSFELAKKEHDANPKNKTISFFDTPVGKAGWQAQALTSEQTGIYKAREEEILANRKRYIKEERDAQIQALQDYIKAYGSAEQQKQAITDGYEKKIREAGNIAEAASLAKKMEEEIGKIDLKKLQDKLNWEQVFSDLERYSTEALRALRENLVKSLDADDITAENAKTIVDKINEIDDKVTQRTDAWASFLPILRERKRLAQEVANAELLTEQAKKKQVEAQAALAAKQLEAQRVLGSQGIKTNDVSVNGLNALLDSLDPASEAFNKLSPIVKELTIYETNLAEATEEAAKEMAKRNSLDTQLKNFNSFKQSLKKGVESAGGSIQYGLNQVQELPELIDAIGLHDTEFGHGVEEFAGCVGNFASAVQKWQSGDFIGAATDAIKGLQEGGSLIERIGGFSFNGSNAAEVNKSLNRLTTQNVYLSKAINNLTAEIGNSAGTKAIKSYEKAIELQKKMEANIQKQLQLQMGYHDSHRSFNYYWKGLSEETLASFNALNGMNWNGDLFNIDADTAKAIMASADIMQQIKDTGKGGYGERVLQWISDLAEQAGAADELTKQINENLTRVSFDQMRSSFLSALMDMEKDSRDFADSITNIMAEALINKFVLNDDYERWLEDWLNRYANAMKEGNQEVMAALRQEAQSEEAWLAHLSQKYLEEIGYTELQKAEELKKKITEIGDSMKDVFRSAITDMEGDASDFEKTIREKIFNSLVDNLVMNDEFNRFIEQMAEQYQKVTTATRIDSEGNLLTGDLEALIRERDEIVRLINEASSDDERIWEWRDRLTEIYAEIAKLEAAEELTEEERLRLQQELTEKLNAEYELRKAMAKTYADMLGISQEFAIHSSPLANIGDDLLAVLQDTSKSVEDWKDEIVKKMTDDLVKELVYGEEYKQKMREFQLQYVAIMSDTTLDAAGKQAALEALADAIATYANQTADSVKDIVKANETLESSFGDLHDSVMDALLDMENGAENFKKKLHETLVKDIIDKKVFGEAFTLNGNPYENFEEYQKDWTKRYLDALEAGDTDLMRELVKEMEERETAMAEAAEQYAKELQEAADDTTFTGMSDSLVSALMDTNKTAEDWAQDIGKTIAKKIFEGMVAEKTLLQGIQDVWDAAVAGATDERGKVDWDNVLANAELQQVAGSTKEEFENLQKAWEALCESLGVTLDAKELPLGDIDSTILESLTDAEESAEDFGKKIALKLMNEMLSKLVNTRYLDEMKAIREMWQHALNGDVDEEGNAYTIERVTQAIEALRAEISGSTEISNLATQIQDLSKASAQADESFKSMGDSWTSVLTDMDATAEDFGRQIGQNLVSKLVKELIVDKELQFYLNNIQDAYNQAIESGMSLEDAVAAVEPKIDEAVEATEKWKPVIDEINQKFQKLNEETPFDDLRSRFRSELMDMSGDVNSFASDLNKSIIEAFIDAFVLADFDDRLEEWKKRYSAIMKSDTMTEAERAKALKDLQNEIVEAKEGYVEGARSIQDLLGYGEYKDQDATVNMADKATYDQFEQYLGIAVSQQITAEHQLGVQLQILSTLQGMAGLSDPVNDSLLTQVALSNSHLSNIYNVNYKMYQSLETRLQTIEMNTAYLKKL